MNDLVMRNREAEYMKQQLDPRRRDVTARDVQGFEKIRPDNRLAEMGGALAQAFSSYAQLGATYLDDNKAKADADFARAMASIETSDEFDPEGFKNSIDYVREQRDTPITFFNTGVGYDKQYHTKVGEMLGKRAVLTVSQVMRQNDSFKDLSPWERQEAVNNLFNDTVNQLLGNANDIEASAAAPFIAEAKNVLVGEVAVIDEMQVYSSTLQVYVDELNTMVQTAFETGATGDEMLAILQEGLDAFRPVADKNGQPVPIIKSEKERLETALYQIAYQAEMIISAGTDKKTGDNILRALMGVQYEGQLLMNAVIEGDTPFVKPMMETYRRLSSMQKERNKTVKDKTYGDILIQNMYADTREKKESVLATIESAYVSGMLDGNERVELLKMVDDASNPYILNHFGSSTSTEAWNQGESLVLDVMSGRKTVAQAYTALQNVARDYPMTVTHYQHFADKFASAANTAAKRNPTLQSLTTGLKQAMGSSWNLGVEIYADLGTGVAGAEFVIGQGTDLSRTTANAITTHFINDANQLEVVFRAMGLTDTEINNIFIDWGVRAQNIVTQANSPIGAPTLTAVNKIATENKIPAYAAQDQLQKEKLYGLLAVDMFSGVLTQLNQRGISLNNEQQVKLIQDLEAIRPGFYTGGRK